MRFQCVPNEGLRINARRYRSRSADRSRGKSARTLGCPLVHKAEAFHGDVCARRVAMLYGVSVPLSTAILIVINEPHGIGYGFPCACLRRQRYISGRDAMCRTHMDTCARAPVRAATRAKAEMHSAAISAEIGVPCFDCRCPEFNICTYVRENREGSTLPCTGTFIIGRYRFNVRARGATRRGVSIY